MIGQVGLTFFQATVGIWLSDTSGNQIAKSSSMDGLQTSANTLRQAVFEYRSNIEDLPNIPFSGHHLLTGLKVQ